MPGRRIFSFLGLTLLTSELILDNLKLFKMTTVNVQFRPLKDDSSSGSIVYVISNNGCECPIPSEISIPSSMWDAGCSAVVADGSPDFRKASRHARRLLQWDVQRIRRIIRRLENDDIPFSPKSVASEFIRLRTYLSLSGFMSEQITRLKGNGRLRTAETYASALASFSRFVRDIRSSETCPPGTDEEGVIPLEAISPELMAEYQRWNIASGNTLNTSSFYMRILRAVYNRAVEQDLIADLHPFRKVYTGVARTVKRALPAESLRTMRCLDLSGHPDLDRARDIFILSFCLRGMSMVDMAFLRKCDLQDGIITYRRRKTGRTLFIEWTREMQDIIDKYPENRSQYLLPIMPSDPAGSPEETMREYRKASLSVNHSLKKISMMAGMAPVTMYAARHSWATTAREIGVPLRVISEGMGHESETTTRIYLASLDISDINRANARVIASVAASTAPGN